MASIPAASSSLSPARAAALVAVAAGLAAALIVLWLVGSVALAAGFFGAAVVVAGGAVAHRLLARAPAPPAPSTDWDLSRHLADASADAVAVTDRAGRLVCANEAYQALFAGLPTPPGLPIGDAGVSALGAAGRAAWRDGQGSIDRLDRDGERLAATIVRAGAEADLLVWRFTRREEENLAQRMAGLIGGATGDRLGAAGVMAALIDPRGRVLAANAVLAQRALGSGDAELAGRDFAHLLITDSRGLVRFEREGLEGTPLRLVQLPIRPTVPPLRPAISTPSPTAR